MSMTRRRLLDDTYKQTAVGNPIQVRSVARMRPEITMQGWTEQASTTGANLFDYKDLLNEDGVIQSNLSAIQITPFNVVEGESYIIITKGTVLENSDYSSVYFGEDELDYFKRDTLIFGTPTGGHTFNNNEEIKTMCTPTKTCTITKCIVHGGNRITEYDVSEFGVFKSDNTDATNYEPYTGGAPSPSPDYPQEIVSAGDWDEENEKYGYEIKITGKNLFEPRNKQIGYMNGNRGEKIQRFGPADENFANWNCDCYALPGAEITWTVNSPVIIRASIHFTDEADIVLEQYYDSSPGLFAKYTTTVPDGCKKIYVSVLDNYAYNNDNIEIQVEYGLESTVYEPFNLQTTMLTSDRPLTEWDRLEKRDGVWGWVYESIIRKFNGTEDWFMHHPSALDTDVFILSNIDGFSNKPVLARNGYCDKYLSATYAAQIGDMQFWDKDHYFGIGRIAFRNDKFTDLDSWKTYLSENPITWMNKAEEETFEPLSEQEQAALNALHTNYPTTVISNEQDCDMSLIYKTRKSLEVSE